MTTRPILTLPVKDWEPAHTDKRPYFEELVRTGCDIMDVPHPAVLQFSSTSKSITNDFTNGRVTFSAGSGRRVAPDLTTMWFEIGNHERWYETNIAHEIAHIVSVRDNNWTCFGYTDASSHTAAFYRALEQTYRALGIDELDVRHALVFEHSYTIFADAQAEIRRIVKNFGWHWDKPKTIPLVLGMDPVYMEADKLVRKERTWRKFW